MESKDIKIGMTVRIKTEFNLNGLEVGKNGIMYIDKMCADMGKISTVEEILIRSVKLEGIGWYLDKDWIEEVECAPALTPSINIHDIHYRN